MYHTQSNDCTPWRLQLVELSTQYLTLALPTVPHRGAFKIKINLAPFKKKKFQFGGTEPRLVRTTEK
jgi:hypothetical protein